MFRAGLAGLPFTLWIKDGKQEHPVVQTIILDLKSAEVVQSDLQSHKAQTP